MPPPNRWQQRYQKARSVSRSAARIRYMPWIAASFLLLDIYAVSSASERNHFPVLGCCCMFAMGKAGRHPYFHNGAVTLEGDKFRVLSKYELLSKRKDNVLAMFFIESDTTSVGLVAPVLKYEEHTIQIRGDTTNAPTIPYNYRQIILDGIASHSDFQRISSERLALLATGDGTKVSIMWPGLIHDLIFIAGIIFFIHACKLAAERRSAKQLITQSISGSLRCTKCSYDIRGLATKGVTHCPECGEVLMITRTTQAASQSPEDTST